MNETVSTGRTHPEGVRYAPAAFAVAGLALVFLLYQFVGGGITLLVAGGNITLDNVMLARTATMLAQIIFLLIPTLWLMRLQHGPRSGVLQWRIPSAAELIIAILGMAALLQVAEGYMYFQDMIPLPESIAPLIDQLKKMIEATYRVLIEAHSVPELLFVIAVVAVTPAICEEILFRALVQKNFSLASNPVRGFIITGVIFGLYHFNPFQAVPLVALGIYFSFLQYRSQSIIIPMAAHFVNNTLSVIVSYVYGFDGADMPSVLKSQMADTSDSSVLLMALFFLAFFFFLMKVYWRITGTKNTAGPAPGGLS